MGDDDEASASPRGDADAVTVRRHGPRGETVAAAVVGAVLGIALMLSAGVDVEDVIILPSYLKICSDTRREPTPFGGAI